MTAKMLLDQHAEEERGERGERLRRLQEAEEAWWM